MEKVKILSIDGGGIRGIIPGRILVELERIISDKLKAKGEDVADVKIGNYFDLVAGTSTGGILSIILLCPDDQGGFRYSAQDALNLYLEHGDKIFAIDLFQRMKSVLGFADEKYDNSALTGLLEQYLGATELKDLMKPCLITTYDIENRNSFFFNQMDAAERTSHNFLAREVAQATSAAPTFFECAQITASDGKKYACVDGGTFANNPALCAYAEVRDKFRDNPKAADMVMLSLGTGYREASYPYEKAKDFGLIGWVKPLLDIMMSGNSETIDYQLGKIFDAVGKRDQYLRVSGEIINADTSMDNATEDNMKKLIKDAEDIIKANRIELEKFADFLI
jgi:patatin-like phospholipase/acyl hydrolase